MPSDSERTENMQSNPRESNPPGIERKVDEASSEQDQRVKTDQNGGKVQSKDEDPVSDLSTADPYRPTHTDLPGAAVTKWQDSFKGRRQLSPERPRIDSTALPETSDTSLAVPTSNSTSQEYVAKIQNKDWRFRMDASVKVITYLEDYPDAHIAEELMRKVANEITPMLQRWNSTVKHLTEFYPEIKSIRGCNSGTGRIIWLRLRDPDRRDLFRSFGSIMSTALHEITHNLFREHDADFYRIWSQLEDKYGIAESDRGDRPNFPRKPYPAGHIALLTGGKKIFVLKPDFEKHFSKLVPQIQTCDLVRIPQCFEAGVVVRLTQLAKGLDPADERPLDQLLNSRDFCCTGTKSFAFLDHFWNAHRDATSAIKLYLRMYKAGEFLGWHSSSKEWLSNRLARRLAWDPRSGDGPYTEPRLQTREDVTLYFIQTVRYLYRETGPDDTCVRRVVAEKLREMTKTSYDEPDRFNCDMLNKLVVEIPDLGESLDTVLE